MGMSEFCGPKDVSESTATIRRAVEIGIDFFGTADRYGSFHNEKCLDLDGKGIRKLS